MRIKTLLCLAALAGGVATTMAQSNVYSLNIVGYVTITNTPGLSAIIANPLNATNNSSTTLFQDAPQLTKFIKWTGSAYATFTRDDDAGGWDPAPFTLNPGEACFINVAGGANYVKTYVGEVQLNSTNPIPTGLTFKSSSIPQAGGVQSVLGFPAGQLDKFIRWTGSAYATSTRDDDAGGWDPSEPNIKVGEGFFVNRAVANGATTWIRNFTVGP